MSEKNPLGKEDPTWQMHMKMLMQRKKSMEIAQTIDEALYQYYVVEQGKEVPNWRYIKDADWWLEYLDSLGIDRKNP